MALFLAISCLSASNAQQVDSTGNLITNNPADWSGVGGYSQLGGAHPTTLWGCCTSYSGSMPFYDTATWGGNGQSGQFIWSYGNATVSTGINVAGALGGTGLQVTGYSWAYDVRNMNGTVGTGQSGIDTLTATTSLLNSAGQAILSDTRVYNTMMEWTRFSGTQTLAAPVSAANLSTLRASFTASDSGFWAGYYGPQIRDIDLRLHYMVDPCSVDPQSSPSCPGFKTYYNMTDDGYALVPLPFTFPFYGQNFTTSFMYTNGVVGFLNNNWGFCCDGTDLYNQTTNSNSPWNFAIYALNTDLYPGPNSRFYTQQTDGGTGLKYTWENVLEIGTNLENTFSVQIKNSGFIGLQYQQVNLNPYRNPLIGIAGDISQGQFVQQYYGPASELNTLALTEPAASGWKYEYTGTEVDQCVANPLSSQSCPGYAQAYHDQQCSLDPLYASDCAGYATAYYNQQCSLNALYDSGCPGYSEAYLAQQCSINALYSTQCSGYSEAYALRMIQEQQAAATTESSTDTTAVAAATSTSTTGTPSTIDSSLVDPTRTETVVAVDVGGVELSLTGEVSAPTGQTQAATEAAKESQETAAKEEETKKEQSAKKENRKRVDPRALAVAIAAVREAETTAKAAAEDAQTASADSAGEGGMGPGLGSGITLRGFRAAGTGDQESDSNSTNNLQNQMQAAGGVNNQGLQASVDLEGSIKTGPSVRRGGKVEGMEGGPDPAQLAAAPADFNSYLTAQLKDAQFYQQREIYKGQRNVDNARLLRGLTGGSDRLHQQMVDQQYQIGN